MFSEVLEGCHWEGLQAREMEKQLDSATKLKELVSVCKVQDFVMVLLKC